MKEKLLASDWSYAVAAQQYDAWLAEQVHLVSLMLYINRSTDVMLCIQCCHSHDDDDFMIHHEE